MANSRRKVQLNGNPIADTSIRQPVFISMIMLLLIVLGGLAYSRMPVNILPDFDFPVVVVSVPYPGAGPETIADQVAQPIEEEVSTLSGLDQVTSTSSEGFAIIVAQFRQEVDSATALQEVRERVVAIRATLPQDIEEPTFQRFNPAQEPVLTLAITSRSGIDSQALRELVDNDIVPRVQQAQGVGSTSLTGGQTRQINVDLDLDRLQGLRIMPSQVNQAIAAANTNIGLGDAMSGDQEFNLRTPSVFESPDDIASVGIPGTPYIIGDIATINDGQSEVDTFSRLNGVDSITLDVRRQSGTNTAAVAEGALRAFEQTVANYPDLQYTVVNNAATEVRQNVLGAIEEIFIALGFAVLVVMFFFSGLRRTLTTSFLPILILLLGFVVLPALGIEVSELYAIVAAVATLIILSAFSDRNTFITVVGLPVIILGTFAGMSLFGLSINIMTLLAISVSVGLVIDDAIVVRENIIHRLEMGDSPMQAASRGAGEVALSVLAMTLTIVAVFVPVTFTTGITGIIFQSFGITVAVAMILSLIEAYTFAPMLSAYFISRKKGKAQHNASAHTTDTTGGRWGQFYARVLNWSLRHRFATLGVGAVVIALTVVSAGGLRTAFLPEQEAYRFGASFQLPAGTPLAETDRQARAFEQVLLQDPAVETVLTTVGGGGGFASGGAAEQASFQVALNRESSTVETIARLRPQLESVPRVAFIPSNYQTGGSTDITSRPIQMQVRSTGDPDEVAPVVEQILATLRDVPGLTDVDTTYSPGAPELRYELIQARANDYGLTNQDLAITMRTLIDGNTAATYREAGEDYDIVVRLREEDRQSVDSLSSISMPIGETLLPISTIADIQQDTSPTSIRRVDRQTEILIGASNTGRNINEVLADVQARVQSVPLPAGVTVSFGGASEDQAEGFAGLLTAMALSVIFVYMVLASQFRSFSQPIVLMLAMPLSFIGAFLALSITGRELDILSMIGMLMLLGLVVKNSILLIDLTNTLRDSGMEKHAALAQAGAQRLRPIMMTSLTIVFGVLPAASGFGYGAALRQGLATVVIGGIITSTMLTLLLVPTAYSLMESVTSRLSRLFRRNRDEEEEHVEESVTPAMPVHAADGAASQHTSTHAHAVVAHSATESNGSAASDGARPDSDTVSVTAVEHRLTPHVNGAKAES
jgi:HAE1 family hydrophobic/amphiphilic exporter-1